MDKEKYGPIGGKEYLIAGSLLIIVSRFFGPFSLLAFGLGIVVYLLGLYFWSVEVDSRPLKLFLVEAALLVAALFVLSWSIKWVLLKPSWGIYNIINSLAPAYPLIVASAIVYRFRMGLFAESTGELNFNLAGNLYLIGALLFPVVIGVVLMDLARFVEAYSYWTLPLAAKRNVPLNFSKTKALGVLVVSLILTPVLANVPFTNYDISKRADGVALYLKTSESVTTADILVKVPEEFCGVRIYIDGVEMKPAKYEDMVTWGPLELLLGLPGEGEIRYHFELPKKPNNVTVKLCEEGFEYSWSGEGYIAEKVENWKNVTFELSR
ncbi:hypothetical protein [Thermococcus gorgonarius]|uniref:Uncharacterized protein n=1 Tax=Thermococcus gorgonarius TaxID=71997 RepID=A0A2Z2M644_THEGO|nr:hypothetical protein [Thermococcus gorgonarius]ASJ00673.1 hypothetical protein A3K92_03875 [Thermococcus gorgonarius]